MAIKTEIYTLNGREFIRTYSNANRYVIGGEPYGKYSEANDPAEFGRTYVEGDLMPEEEWILPQAIIEDKAEAYDILIGDIN